MLKIVLTLEETRYLNVFLLTEQSLNPVEKRIKFGLTVNVRFIQFCYLSILSRRIF